MRLPHQPRPDLRRSPRWTGARALIATVLLTASAGCAAAAASSGPAPAGAAASGTAQQSPAAVGLAYTQYLFAGNFSRASALVLPGDRNIITILFTGLSSGSFRTENLAVGSVATKGSSAMVILTGKICSSGAAPKNVTNAPRPNEECQENKDPKSVNPAFRVSLCNSAHTWYVCFPRPQPGGGEQASSTAGAGASAAHG
ncbi:hypothetical protein EDD99_0701 [Streptomyces sp. 846.5]|nr:hypothetical protein EDD99_0701 [Streptomyces sp. 846.5]